MTDRTYRMSDVLVDIHELSDFEKDMLLDLAGHEKGKVSWGAAMSASLGPMTARGLLKRTSSPKGVHYDLSVHGRTLADTLWAERGKK